MLTIVQELLEWEPTYGRQMQCVCRSVTAKVVSGYGT